METTKNVLFTFCSRDQSVIGTCNSAEVTQLWVPMNLYSHEYDLLRYCRMSFNRRFTENCANFLMLTLFFFKPILSVGKLIGDIIGDLLGKILNLIELSPLPGVCSELADIFIIFLFNVDLALYCCSGCLKRRNVRQRP